MNNPREDTFTQPSVTLVIQLGEPGAKSPGHFRSSLRDERGIEGRWELTSRTGILPRLAPQNQTQL
ncbi:MAG TPA: hypothetical protein VHY09_10695 [Candidatus Methylacidiphilales bacterium]|jgi:hypothetical protein|nr:hypothetical protein [Candidatus Methylacidiphilales bacterium]